MSCVDEEPRQKGKTDGRTTKETLLAWLKGWQGAVLAAGALAAAILSILKVADLAFQRDHSPPIAARNAAFTMVDLAKKNASRHDYCRTEFQGDALAKCLAGADSVGNIFDVGVRFTGYEGKCCSLSWTLMDKSGEVATDPTTGTPPNGFSDVNAISDIAPRNPLGDSRIFNVFVPNPGFPGDFRIEFALADRDGRLKTRQSELFQVR
jgi:hypothetical protein